MVLEQVANRNLPAQPEHPTLPVQKMRGQTKSDLFSNRLFDGVDGVNKVQTVSTNWIECK